MSALKEETTNGSVVQQGRLPTGSSGWRDPGRSYKGGNGNRRRISGLDGEAFKGATEGG